MSLFVNSYMASCFRNSNLLLAMTKSDLDEIFKLFNSCKTLRKIICDNKLSSFVKIIAEKMISGNQSADADSKSKVKAMLLKGFVMSMDVGSSNLIFGPNAIPSLIVKRAVQLAESIAEVCGAKCVENFNCKSMCTLVLDVIYRGNLKGVIRMRSVEMKYLSKYGDHKLENIWTLRAVKMKYRSVTRAIECQVTNAFLHLLKTFKHSRDDLGDDADNLDESYKKYLIAQKACNEKVDALYVMLRDLTVARTLRSSMKRRASKTSNRKPKPEAVTMQFGASEYECEPEAATMQFGASDDECEPDAATMQFGASDVECEPDAATMQFGASDVECEPDAATMQFGASDDECEHDAATMQFGV
jgi:hypothetical protein